MAFEFGSEMFYTSVETQWFFRLLQDSRYVILSRTQNPGDGKPLSKNLKDKYFFFKNHNFFDRKIFHRL